jgi:hypothetical protein
VGLAGSFLLGFVCGVIGVIFTGVCVGLLGLFSLGCVCGFQSQFYCDVGLLESVLLGCAIVAFATQAIGMVSIQRRAFKSGKDRKRVRVRERNVEVVAAPQECACVNFVCVRVVVYTHMFVYVFVYMCMFKLLCEVTQE